MKEGIGYSLRHCPVFPTAATLTGIVHNHNCRLLAIDSTSVGDLVDIDVDGLVLGSCSYDVADTNHSNELNYTTAEHPVRLWCQWSGAIVWTSTTERTIVDGRVAFAATGCQFQSSGAHWTDCYVACRRFLRYIAPKCIIGVAAQ